MAMSAPTTAFSGRSFLPPAVMERVTETRLRDPDYAFRQASERIRPVPTAIRRLNILAADHPARGVVKSGDDPLAMADRHEYLARVLRSLLAPGVDGVMATMDILEDLLAISGFFREANGPAFLDGKLLIASLNRGGLAGSSWELDDPVTGPRPATCAAWRLDGAKFLLRVANEDPGSLKTLIAAAEAITEANALRLPMFLEPLPVSRTEKGWSVRKDAAALARLVGVASALGDSSRYLWLKLPYCADFGVAARAASLPILLLGGESAGSPGPFLEELRSAFDAGTNVRGALAGRNVLYPGQDDPRAMAAAVGCIVHEGRSVEEALASMAEHRGRELDFFAPLLGRAGGQ
jgi:hypothetical protein